MVVTTPPASAASAPVSRRHSSRPRRSAPVQARGVPVCESESTARKPPFTPSTWLACPCGPSVTGAQLCPSAVKPASWLPSAPYPSVPRSPQAKKPPGDPTIRIHDCCGNHPGGVARSCQEEPSVEYQMDRSPPPKPPLLSVTSR